MLPSDYWRKLSFIIFSEVKVTNGTLLRIKSDGKHRTFYQRHTLHDMGYTFSGEMQEWVKQSTGNDIQLAQAFCRRYGFHLVIDLPQYRRSSNYRQEFFIAHPGVGKSEHYFCSYCGCLLCKEKITVDHLISVNAAQKSRFAEWILHRLGIKNVNDAKNLVPSCRRCNQQKGTKSGVWLIRGLIGRHAWFWLIFWPTFLFCVIFAVVLAAQYSFPVLMKIINFIRG